MCDRLEGNVCGDFLFSIIKTAKIKTKTNGGKGSKKAICERGQRETEMLEFGSQMEAELWFTKFTSGFTVSCFLWATENGNIPKSILRQEENKKFLPILVNILQFPIFIKNLFL